MAAQHRQLEGHEGPALDPDERRVVAGEAQEVAGQPGDRPGPTGRVGLGRRVGQPYQVDPRAVAQQGDQAPGRHPLPPGDVALQGPPVEETLRFPHHIAPVRSLAPCSPPTHRRTPPAPSVWNPVEGSSAARQVPTSSLTAAARAARPALASAKSMRVFGSVYSSFSRPEYPAPIERLITMTERAWSTSRIGMPEMAVPGRRAAGLTTSLAPMTRATSVRANSGLISSMLLSWGYGTSASASRTFMWPGMRPATGWMA